MDVLPNPIGPAELKSPRERIGESKTKFDALVRKRSEAFPGSRESDSQRPSIWNEALDIMTPLRGEIEKAAKKPSFLQKVLPPEEVKTAKQTFRECLRMVREEVTTEFKHLGKGNVMIVDNEGSINFNLDSKGAVQQIFLNKPDGSFDSLVTIVDPDNLDSASLERLKVILHRISNYKDRNEAHHLWHRRQEYADEGLKKALSNYLKEHPASSFKKVVDAKKQFQGLLKGFFERRKGRGRDAFLANLVQDFVRSKGVAGGTMIDIAAGAGWESLAAVQAGAKSAVMLDISQFSQTEALKRQKEAPDGSTVTAATIDITRDSFPPVEGRYQGAICCNVLELLTVQERQHIMSEAFRNLAPGQHFLVVTEEIPTTGLLATPSEQLGDTWHALPKKNMQTFPWHSIEDKRVTREILGLTFEEREKIPTTVQLTEFIQSKISNGGLPGLSGIAWEGCRSEEIKAQLSNAGFVIDQSETEIINPDSRYADGTGGRPNQFFIIARKPSEA